MVPTRLAAVLMEIELLKEHLNKVSAHLESDINPQLPPEWLTYDINKIISDIRRLHETTGEMFDLIPELEANNHE